MRSAANWRFLLSEARRRLLEYSGVTGVGLGPGKDQSSPPVWRVYVVGDKQARESPAARRTVPRTLLGLATEIHIARPGFAATGKPTIYSAGVQIECKIPGTFLHMGPSEKGALGCFARDSAGKPVLLTNSHVMFPAFIAVPHLGIYQPDYSSCCSSGDKIATPEFDPKEVKDGKFKGGFKTQLGDAHVPAPNDKGFTKMRNVGCSETDCAIARLDPGVVFKNVLPAPDGEIVITGQNREVLSIIGPTAGTAPKTEQYVRVFTPRDGGKLIYGTICTRITTEPGVDTIKVDEGTPDERLVTPIFDYGFVDQSPESMEARGSMPAINQFIILPRPKPIAGETDYRKFYGKPGDELSFDHGDSGSVVIDYKGQVVAQIIGGFEFIPDDFVQKPAQRKLIEFTSVKNVAIASPIRGVLDQLNITIPTGGFSGTVPSAGTATRVQMPGLPHDAEAAAQRRAADRLREALRASRRGKLLLGKIAQHRDEVRRLLATRRAISSAWTGLHGPRLYHHCVRNAREPAHMIPTSVNGVTRERLVHVLMPLVARHGGPKLRRDIDRYGPWLVATLLPVVTLDDVPKALDARGVQA